jgi:hypothetical protein
MKSVSAAEMRPYVILDRPKIEQINLDRWKIIAPVINHGKLTAHDVLVEIGNRIVPMPLAADRKPEFRFTGAPFQAIRPRVTRSAFK